MRVATPLRILLWPLSVIYGAGVRMRTRCYAQGWFKQNRLKGAVISVGNLTVGGTGKTPMVLWLAEKFLAERKRVAILSRGYRGSNGTSDEIEMLRSRLGDRVIFGIGKDRSAEGRRLEKQESIDVFLLDDGFQHLALARDLDILLMDASQDIGHESLLPAGSLREPVRSISRVDILVFTRAEATSEIGKAIEQLKTLPVFTAATQLLGFRKFGSVEFLQRVDIGAGPFFAFCGIGNPQAFFRDLERWGLPVCGTMTFRDHHRYRPSDGERLQKASAAAHAKAFITTEKDAQNLSRVSLQGIPVYVAVIELAISPEVEFHVSLDRVLAGKRGASA